MKMEKLCSFETSVTVYQLPFTSWCSITSQNTTVRNMDFEVVTIILFHSFLIYFCVVWSVSVWVHVGPLTSYRNDLPCTVALEVWCALPQQVLAGREWYMTCQTLHRTRWDFSYLLPVLNIRHLILVSRFLHDQNGLVQPVLVCRHPDCCDNRVLGSGWICYQGSAVCLVGACHPCGLWLIQHSSAFVIICNRVKMLGG